MESDPDPEYKRAVEENSAQPRPHRTAPHMMTYMLLLLTAADC